MDQRQFSSDFTQTNGALVAPWVNSGWNGNAGALQVVSNRLRSNAAAATELPMSVIDTVYPPNQYLEFSLPTFSVSAGVTIYAMGQLRIAAAPTQTYYRFWVSSVAGVTRIDFSSIVNGGTENFFDSITTTIAAGARIRLECRDVYQLAYVNGALVKKTTNADISAGGRFGLSVYWTAGAVSDLEIDDLIFGTINVQQPVAMTSRPRPFAPGLAR